MANRPKFQKGAIAHDPRTGQEIMFDGMRWGPVQGNMSRDGTPINPKYQATLSDQDARRVADVAGASRAALEALPRIQELRGVVQSPDTQMGGFGPAARFIDQFTPGILPRAKDQADRLDSLSTQVATPLARAMAPVSDTDFDKLRQSIADVGVSKPAAMRSVDQLQFEANRGAWYNRKLNEWVQAYGSPSAPASRSFPGELEAVPGETFDQYFARWSEFNTPTLNHSKGAFAPVLPADMQRAGQRSLRDRMAFTGGAKNVRELSDQELLDRLNGGRR